MIGFGKPWLERGADQSNLGRVYHVILIPDLQDGNVLKYKIFNWYGSMYIIHMDM